MADLVDYEWECDNCGKTWIPKTGNTNNEANKKTQSGFTQASKRNNTGSSKKKPSNIDKEKRYVKLYKECLKDSVDGTISYADRECLDSLRDRLGISKTRAKELERSSGQLNSQGSTIQSQHGESIVQRESAMDSSKTNIEGSKFPLNKQEKGETHQFPIRGVDHRNELKSNLPSNEHEYVQMVKECLIDGEIGTQERKILYRLYAKLGISSSRALELETTLRKTILNDEEKEYLDAYNEVLADGQIGDKVRIMLKRLQDMLSISDERVREIEELYL